MPVFKIKVLTDDAIQFDPQKCVYWHLGSDEKIPAEHKIDPPDADVVFLTENVRGCNVVLMREVETGMYWFLHAMPPLIHERYEISPNGEDVVEAHSKRWAYSKLPAKLNGGDIGLSEDAKIEMVKIIPHVNDQAVDRHIKVKPVHSNSIVTNEAYEISGYSVEYTVPKDAKQEGQLRIIIDRHYIQYQQDYKHPFTSNERDPDLAKRMMLEVEKYNLAENIQTTVNRGLLFLEKNKRGYCFTEALEIFSNPKDIVFLTDEKIAKSISQMLKLMPEEKAVELDFRKEIVVKAKSFLTIIEIISGDCSEAEAKSSAERTPKLARLIYSLYGKFCENKNDLNKAIEYYQKTIDLKDCIESEKVVLNTNLALIFEKKQQPQQAKEILEKNLEILTKPTFHPRYKSPGGDYTKEQAIQAKQIAICREGIIRCSETLAAEKKVDPSRGPL